MIKMIERRMIKVENDDVKEKMDKGEKKNRITKKRGRGE